jgi:membrane protein
MLAGVAMQWLQFFYINSQLWVTGYNAIYGSFAALPLFMLWVQISWTICLFGAELSYATQNLDYYDYNVHTADISHRYRMMLSVVLMSRICRRFADGRPPYSAGELREETGIPIRIVNDLLFKLQEARLLIEISADEKGGASRYMPAESLDNLSVGVMIDRLEAQGKWQIKLRLDELLKGGWSGVIEQRSLYLKKMREVRLENL